MKSKACQARHDGSAASKFLSAVLFFNKTAHGFYKEETVMKKGLKTAILFLLVATLLLGSYGVSLAAEGDTYTMQMTNSVGASVKFDGTDWYSIYSFSVNGGGEKDYGAFCIDLQHWAHANDSYTSASLDDTLSSAARVRAIMYHSVINKSVSSVLSDLGLTDSIFSYVKNGHTEYLSDNDQQKVCYAAAQAAIWAVINGSSNPQFDFGGGPTSSVKSDAALQLYNKYMQLSGMSNISSGDISISGLSDDSVGPAFPDTYDFSFEVTGTYSESDVNVTLEGYSGSYTLTRTGYTGDTFSYRLVLTDVPTGDVTVKVSVDGERRDAMALLPENSDHQKLAAILYESYTVTDSFTLCVEGYDVTFYDEDGTTVIDSQSVNYNQYATAPADLTKTGYTFKGWTTDGGATTVSKATIDATQVTANVEYTAVYEVASYDVTFYKEDGTTVIDSQSVDYNEYATAPSDLTKTGYTFKGWTTDGGATLLSKATIDATAVTANVEYTAVFEINSYDVTFYDEDGTTVIDSQSVDYNEYATAPADLTKTGYTFKGWTTDGGATTASKATIDATQVTVNVEYTAVFEINSYDVTFYDEDGTTVLDSQSVDYNEYATAPTDPSKTGYTFKGWTTDGGATLLSKATIDATQVTANVEYTAVFEINSYDVTFYKEDGTTGIDSQSVDYNEYATAPADLTKTGYTFKGWTTDGGATLLSKATIDATQVTANVEYTAVFEINSYDVTYNEGTNGTLVRSSSEQVSYNQTPANVPDITPDNGYVFLGWLKNGTGSLLTKQQVDDMVIDADTTFTAQYQQIEYVITFIIPGNGSSSDQMIFIGLHYGDTFPTIPGVAADTGYTFSGWSPNLTVQPQTVTGSAVYVAQITQDQYTVTFVDYDGALLGADVVTYGGSATAPSDPTREGYTFTGWSPSYDNVTGDLTVTAQYAINTYTVRFFEQDGITQIGETQTINWGTAATFETAPAITGYAFDEWGLTGDDATVATSLRNVRENIDAVASYIENGYTVTFVDYDGTVLGTDGVTYGGSAVAPDDPEREGYTFTGWDVPFNNVTANITVTAEYTINTYTVTFVDYDGTVIDTQTVDWNTGATAPDDPEREGYEFTEWDVPFDTITADTTVTAQYDELTVLEDEDVAAAIEDEPVPETGSNSSGLWWLLLLLLIPILFFLLYRNVIVTYYDKTDDGEKTRKKRYWRRRGDDEEPFEISLDDVKTDTFKAEVIIMKGLAKKLAKKNVSTVKVILNGNAIATEDVPEDFDDRFEIRDINI